SIFVRKTLYIRPRDQKMPWHFLSSQAGYTFFDEDGVCCRFWELSCCLSELLRRANILQEFQERFAVQEKKLVIFFHVVHFVLDFLTSGSAHPDRKDRSLAVPVIRRPA
ncbi:MAG: hypothetical protein IKG01_05955, partial [Lachnospiraceae bacterium]|nr:hypothetical protein [Lachnospiraceae bacterium]